MSQEPIHTDGPVHEFFGLTYSGYLVLPRALLQSMPVEWQARFVACLEEMRSDFPGMPDVEYVVSAVNSKGRFIADPIPHYNRGRTRVEPRSKDPARHAD